MKRNPARPKPDHPAGAPRQTRAPQDHVVAGAVAGPHGVRGRVRVKSFTTVAEDVAAYGPVMVAGGRRLKLAVEGAAKGMLIVRIEGVDTRNEAEALKGELLYLPRAALPEPDEDEFYHADLIGLEAVQEDGKALGRVVAVHDFGAGGLLEIALTGEGQTVLMPFTRETVPQVDLAAGRLICKPPEGLLESGAPGEEEGLP
jgi:16S rRNA processing protein RimM